MIRSLRIWLIPLLVTVAMNVVLAWRHQITVSLQEAVQREREISRNQAEQRAVKKRAATENRMLEQPAGAIGSDDEAGLAQLRRVIAELESRASERARV